MRLNKSQLDTWTTVLGLIIGISDALVTFEFVPARGGGLMRALGLVFLAALTQRPASDHPTTAEAEREELR